MFHRFGQFKFASGGFFKLEPIFATATEAYKNDPCYESGQNRPENNHLATLI